MTDDRPYDEPSKDVPNPSSDMDKLRAYNRSQEHGFNDDSEPDDDDTGSEFPGLGLDDWKK